MNTLNFNDKKTSLQRGDLITVYCDGTVKIEREGTQLTFFENKEKSFKIGTTKDDWRGLSNTFFRILRNLFGMEFDDINHTASLISKQIKNM